MTEFLYNDIIHIVKYIYTSLSTNFIFLSVLTFFIIFLKGKLIKLVYMELQ